MVLSIPASRPCDTPAPPRQSWRRFRRHSLATVSLALLVTLVAIVLIGPFLWRTPVDDIDLSAALQGPDVRHPLGTDGLGQDLLARALHGGRTSMAVGMVSAAIAVVIGVVVGATAGFAGGLLDAALMWVTNLFLSLPQLPLLLVVIYLFRDRAKAMLGAEAGEFLLVVAGIGCFRWMHVARLVRVRFQALLQKEFIESARALGASRWRIVWRHMLPNALGPVIVAGTIDVAASIIAESTLSFLGLGFSPEIPSWGRMLYEGKDQLDVAARLAVVPGIAIFLTVLAVNFVGAGLRDALDPRHVL